MTKTIVVPALALILGVPLAGIYAGSKSSDGTTPAVSGTPMHAAPPALSGKLMFDQLNWITHKRVAMVELSLPDVSMRRLGSGAFPWRHPDGDYVFAQGCGPQANRLAIATESAGPRVVSPCSNEVEAPDYSSPRFEFSRISPDKRYVAAEMVFLVDLSNSQYGYSTVVLEDGEIIAYFNGFAAPEWLPDGRLLLAGDGIYVTEIDGTPTRLDDGTLSAGVNNMDLHPGGEMVMFEWKQQLWLMSIDGREFKEMVSGPAWYRFPAWSPDGNYVAFLSMTGEAPSETLERVYFLDIRDGSIQDIDISEFGGNLSHRPAGPLSWTP